MVDKGYSNCTSSAFVQAQRAVTWQIACALTSCTVLVLFRVTIFQESLLMLAIWIQCQCCLLYVYLRITVSYAQSAVSLRPAAACQSRIPPPASLQRNDYSDKHSAPAATTVQSTLRSALPILSQHCNDVAAALLSLIQHGNRYLEECVPRHCCLPSCPPPPPQQALRSKRTAVCSPGWQAALHTQSVELQITAPMPTCCKLPVDIAQPGMLHQCHLHMHKGETADLPTCAIPELAARTACSG